MEYDELLATAISLQETSLTGPVPPSSIQTNNNDIRQVHTTFTSSESSTMSSTLMGQADVVDLSNDTEEEVNPVLNQKLQQFVEISGADKTAAKHLLEVTKSNP